MGRSLLLTVILITAIFASIAITLLQKSNSLPKVSSKSLGEIALKNTGAFALNFAIKELQNNSTLRENITVYPNYHALTYSNFELSEGRIDSIKFASYTVNVDSLPVLPAISPIAAVEINNPLPVLPAISPIAAVETDNFLQILAVVSTIVDGERKYHTSEARLAVINGPHANQVGGWHFDETAGITALEFAMGNYNGTLVNFNNPDNSWDQGVWGNSLNLDGNNDYVDLPPEVVDSYSDKFTASSWVKLDHSFIDWGTVMSEQKSNNNKTLVWAVRSNIIDITFWGWTLYSELTYKFILNTIGNPNTSSVAITRRGSQIDIYDWHFIVVTYDGTYSNNKARIELQIFDENLSASKIINKMQYHSGNHSPNELTIGGLETNNPWSGFFDQFHCIDGNVDEVNLFNVILPAEDIITLFAENGFATDNIIYWRQ